MKKIARKKNVHKKVAMDKLQIVCMAVLILCFCEAGALFLSPVFSPVATLSVIRSAQTACLLLLLMLTPGGLEFAGLSNKNAFTGLKTGLIISFLFGLAVLIIGCILYLTGIPPLSFIYSPLPRDNRILFFLCGGLISPIGEELFFRGIVYSFLRQWGIHTALVFTTAVFALFHLPNGGLPIFQLAGGLIFALSFEISKSLVTPMVIHILGNLALFSIALVRFLPVSHKFF